MGVIEWDFRIDWDDEEHGGARLQRGGISADVQGTCPFLFQFCTSWPVSGRLQRIGPNRSDIGTHVGGTNRFVLTCCRSISDTCHPCFLKRFGRDVVIGRRETRERVTRPVCVFYLRERTG